MSDVNCRVCGEPFDYWGACHGDMAAWEWDLFRKGAGCPCCKGVKPEELSDDDALEGHLHSVVFEGGDDPDEFDMLHNPTGKKPEWVEPEPRVLWTCEGCGVSVVISNEAPYDGSKVSDDDIWLRWHGGRKVHYLGSEYAYSYSSIARELPEHHKEPSHVIAGKNYCPGCACSCAECGRSLFQRSELEGDSFDEGSSFPHPANPFWGSVCLDCLSSLSDGEDEPPMEKLDSEEELEEDEDLDDQD